MMILAQYGSSSELDLFGSGVEGGLIMIAVFGVVVFIGLLMLVVRCYKRVDQGFALVINTPTRTKVSFTGAVVIPVFHRAEFMDISVKTLEIERIGVDGLICKDNMRSDIKVVFFVRVNKTLEDVKEVAATVGCKRASDQKMLQELFDAKFSEALKTVGRQFDYVELLNARREFRDEIIKLIGRDLNGYVLQDVAIDYLEQTKKEFLSPDNILDAEGIKKITDLTAIQLIQANQIDRDKEKTITQQDVEAQEAILELNKQLAEAEEKQKREIAAIKAREEAEAKMVQENERLKSEKARIATEEEIEVGEENRSRSVIVAQRNKERTDAVESERIEKDRSLEVVERERIVELAQIEKTRAVEVEKKSIQDVIRERVQVERKVVEEQELIKDTEAIAQAERDKKVQITEAERDAEKDLVKELKSAEAQKEAAELKAQEDQYRVVMSADAEKQAAELRAKEKLIDAEANEQAAERNSAAKKKLAEAQAAEAAASGLAEAQVMEAKAVATEKHGMAEAHVIEKKAVAEASGIHKKAEAMKLFDEYGRDHEEFRLRLDKDKEVELSAIGTQKEIAAYRAEIVGEALKNANVDIIGGESVFFDKIAGAVAHGKSVDRVVENSDVLRDVKETFFNSDPEYFRGQLHAVMDQLGVKSEDLMNLSIAGALGKLISLSSDTDVKGKLERLLGVAQRAGIQDANVTEILSSRLN